jgi:hypothetical protein
MALQARDEERKMTDLRVSTLTPAQFYRAVNGYISAARYPFRLILSRHFEFLIRSSGDFESRPTQDGFIGVYRTIPVQVLDIRPTIHLHALTNA